MENREGPKRLLKCFCGCTEMTVEEVKRIYYLSAQETLIDQQSLRMLRSFLQMRRSGDKSEAEQFLDIYEQCGKYLMQRDIPTLDELEELQEMGLPYDLEKKLNQHLKTGVRFHIEGCLLVIQGECRNRLESSTEYTAYKSEILKKLRQTNIQM